MNTTSTEEDKINRELALNPQLSFIVQAPAGSGKTELLMQRFLVLLTQVKLPEEILAITFTKKAASEMRLRVIKALKQACYEPEPKLLHKKKTWHLAKKVLQQDKIYNWQLLENPSQLRIQTIDALCAYMNKQLPLLSNFGSTPDIADNPSLLYTEAVQEVLLHSEANSTWSSAFEKLLLHLDNDLNKLQALLVGLLSRRDQWLSYIQFHSADAEIKNNLEKQLQLIIAESLTTVIDHFPQNQLTELLSIAEFVGHTIEIKDLKTDKTSWIALSNLLLTKSFSWRKRLDESIGFTSLKNITNPHELAVHKDYRQRLISLITKLNENENLHLALTELYFLPEATYTDEQWEVLQALLQILKILLSQLRLTFQKHSQIDFIENTQAALLALGDEENVSDLSLSLDYQIKHILIDEFQDTAYCQHQLLNKLIQGWEVEDGRTLFVVGDPMQSIYRFREAEVGLFIRMREIGISHIKLIPISLSINFRSYPSIIEWNNRHFSSIFPRFNDMASGAVSYHSSVSVEKSKISAPGVMVKGLINASDEIEANFVVDIISKLICEHPKDEIAILVRSRSHLSAIIPALKKANIVYSAIDIDPLFAKPFIQDLFSLTCALIHPADRIAWLSILRAPWCGLSLADLLVIADNKEAMICNQLENKCVIEKLSQSGQDSINKIFPILKTKMIARERFDARSWIEGTWILLGGAALLESYEDNENVNAFFDLLTAHYAKYSFIDVFKLKNELQQLYAHSQKHNALLRIMTIHAAKGLEFDTVILPQLHKKPPLDDKPLLTWMERPLKNNQSALMLAPLPGIKNEENVIYDYIRRLQQIKSHYEIDRLFYVAATRAKKRLYLSFHAEEKIDGELKIAPHSFLQKIWPLIRNDKSCLTHFNVDTLTPTDNKAPKKLHRLSPHWINPISEQLPKKVRSKPLIANLKLSDNTAKLCGIVIHHIFYQISVLGTHWWLQQNENDQHAYLQSQLKQIGLLIHKLAYAIQIIYKAIDNFLKDKHGLWILKPREFSHAEYALTAVIDSKIENLIVDKVFLDGNNTLWIIDYKTSLITEEEIEDFLANQKKKYYQQMFKYYQAFKMQHKGAVRLGLYFPALPAWEEVTFTNIE